MSHHHNSSKVVHADFFHFVENDDTVSHAVGHETLAEQWPQERLLAGINAKRQH